MNIKLCTLFLTIAMLATAAVAQDLLGTYQVRVSLDRESWITVEVFVRAGGDAAGHRKDGTTSAQAFSVDPGAMKEPGFFRGIATVDKDGPENWIEESLKEGKQ